MGPLLAALAALQEALPTGVPWEWIVTTAGPTAAVLGYVAWTLKRDLDASLVREREQYERLATETLPILGKATEALQRALDAEKARAADAEALRQKRR